MVFIVSLTQELFDAICCQTNLEYLHIFHGPYKDISPIENLAQLKYLSILSGSSVAGIKPIESLSKLVALKLWHLPKVTDYSGLAKLTKLKYFDIEGDGNAPCFTTVDSLEFSRDMKQLKRLSLETLKICTKDLSPIASLKNLESLHFCLRKEYDKQYPHLLENLPKLLWYNLNEG